MTTSNKLNEYNHAGEPACRLPERLGWAYVPRETLAEERGDVVWHTPGSGKSLTMLWLATKPRLGNPTIIVVADRTQLDRQIDNTFARCGFPAPEQSLTTHDLRLLLTTGTGRTVMTTIQKFEEVLTVPEGELDALNDSDNVMAMVDEAHHTQYGILGGRMSRALPNAVLIDSYTIPQPVAEAERRIQMIALDITEHGPSPVSFVIYELLDGLSPGPVSATSVGEEQAPYRTEFNEATKHVALEVESVVNRYNAVVDWQSNWEVEWEMRRDIKREFRPTGNYTEEWLEDLVSRILELVSQRGGR